jgi:hypothetical protein
MGGMLARLGDGGDRSARLPKSAQSSADLRTMRA